jgi:putative MATE family efflux protein
MSPPRAPGLAREVAGLAWPAVVAGLLGTVVLFTDRLLLARHSDAALGSMQVSGPLIWSVHAVFGALQTGAVALIGRAVGAGDLPRARAALKAALGASAAIGAAVGAIGLAAQGPVIEAVVGAAPELRAMRQMSAEYLTPLWITTPIALVGGVAVAALQAAGDTRTPMALAVAAALLNLALSYGLLFGAWGLPELGVMGSAIGSAAAFAAQAGLGLWALGRASGPVPWTGPDGGPALPVLLRVSGPAFGEKLLFHTAFMGFASYVGRLGPQALVAHQACIAIESLGFIAAHGFGVAAASLVARKLGAGDASAARRAAHLSAGLGAATLGAVSLVFLAFGPQLMGLFSADPEVISLGVRCLQVAAVAQPIMAVADTYGGSLRGAGETRVPMWVALAGPVAVRLVACHTLAFELGLGLPGIWIGTTLDWGVRAVALAAAFSRGRWAAARVR